MQIGCPLHPEEHNTLIFTGESNQGWGAHLEKHDSQWHLDRSRKNITYQCPRDKDSVSSPKRLSKQPSRQKNSDSNRQCLCGQLSEQTGGTHSWDMCLLVWHILAYCNPRNILIRARHIQGCLNVIADSLSRKDKVIQTEWSLHPQMFNLICKVWHKPMVDMFATKMNNKLPLYVSTVPEANALNTDALDISWEGLDSYVFCPVALIQKMNTYWCKMIVAAPGWPMIHWFWDLTSITASSLASSVETTIQ